jgi:hypothetical protein
MPAEELITDLGWQLLDMLPPVLRGSYDYQAVHHAAARELELLESRIEQVRAQFFPQTADILLVVWEAQLGLEIAPGGYTVEQRRSIVLAALGRMVTDGSGATWEALITAIAGAGWDYEEAGGERRTLPSLSLYPSASTLPAGSGQGVLPSMSLYPSWRTLPGQAPVGPGRLRIYLPFPASGDRFRRVRQQIEAITDAHLAFDLVSTAGFLLDESQMDLEGMGI